MQGSVRTTNKRRLLARADVCCVVKFCRRGVVPGRSADEAHHTAVRPQSRAACRRCMFGTGVADHVSDLVARRAAAEPVGRAHRREEAALRLILRDALRLPMFTLEDRRTGKT